MSQFGNPLSIMPPVVKNLLIINVLMLFITWVAQTQLGIDLNRYLAIYFFKSEFFRPHQFISYMFMHGGIAHLFFNMFALFMFGQVLEKVWGSKRFLIYYLVTGIGAALVQTAVNWYSYSDMVVAVDAFKNTPTPELLSNFIHNHFSNINPKYYNFVNLWSENPENAMYINQAVRDVQQMATATINIPTVGASGAIFGILLAFGMLFPNTELFLLFPPIPIKAKYFVIGYGILELFMGVQNQSGDNVAHFAHLGGMLFGFILLKYWQKHSNKFY